MRRIALRAVAAPLLTLLLAAGPTLAALTFPQLSGRVVDNADVLSAEEERRLADQLASHEQATSNQIVVVTLPSLQGMEIEEFGYQLGRHWALGQTGRDNGVLLIVAPNERKVRIEVGYGLEGDLPDAIARAIIDRQILPAFRAGDLPRGIADGASAIILAIEGAYEPITERDQPGIHPILILLIIAFIGIVLQVFYSNDFDWRQGRRTIRSRSGYGSGDIGGGGGLGAGGFGGGGGGFSGGGGGFGGGGSSGSW